MNRDTIKILIADDSRTFLEGMKLLLSRTPNYKITGIFPNGLELLKSPLLRTADVLLIDIEMPVMNGIETAKRISYEFPHIPMIALTMHVEKIFLNDIISAGFKGFVHKPEVSKQIDLAIGQVLKKQLIFPNNLKTE